MAPDTWSGVVTAAVTAGSLIVSGAWALVQVCVRLDRMERTLGILLEAHAAREHREGR